ncbi:MAG: hypothetical protein A2V67_11525 [Deltaproteobacteria bacterium RBG_13_61_14]|nr:MAG: hypothetical protein A2V67_11525 [Deltaproteobacteria bacterium RBG_13_61_14]
MSRAFTLKTIIPKLYQARNPERNAIPPKYQVQSLNAFAMVKLGSAGHALAKLAAGGGDLPRIGKPRMDFE